MTRSGTPAAPAAGPSSVRQDSGRGGVGDDRPHVVVLDNYDSFTYNLVHALEEAGARTTVLRNDATDRAGIAALRPDGIVLSPGPGHPRNRRDFGVCTDLVRDPLPVPMLGVCLGMQGMALWTGGAVDRAPELVHGEADEAHLAPHPWLQGTPRRIPVGRYHSLRVAADGLPEEWDALGATRDGTLMAIAHRSRPWMGLQFHPESILTPDGPRIIRNFVEACR